MTVSESSERRKRTTFAMSRGSTHFEVSASGCDERLAGVSITLGRIALARIPSFLYSASSACTKASSAALPAT